MKNFKKIINLWPVVCGIIISSVVLPINGNGKWVVIGLVMLFVIIIILHDYSEAIDGFFKKRPTQNRSFEAKSKITIRIKKILTEIFYKTLFLIPIGVGLPFVVSSNNNDEDWIGFFIFLVAVLLTAFACFKYGYDEKHRNRVKIYIKRENVKPLRERDYWSKWRVDLIKLTLTGFFLVLLTIKILSFFNLL